MIGAAPQEFQDEELERPLEVIGFGHGVDIYGNGSYYDI